MAEVLVVGNGGREAALEQAINESEEVERVVVSGDLVTGLGQLSQTEKPLVIIGPEAPLVSGMADELRAEGYPVFGASKAAAQYEASKSFTVRMLRKAGVLHPNTHISLTLDDALAYVNTYDPLSYVIKADGLAGGKGVVLPSSTPEALDTVYGMKSGRLFDGAGEEIINFADRHRGPEISGMVVVGDNDEFVILPIAQDHKRLGENDTGPNTGGMGSYAPVPEAILSGEQYSQLYEATEKTLASMRAMGTPFERGLLYGGFMLSEQEGGKPVVIEYNVRFGDPETQAILPLLTRAGIDVYRLLHSAAEGSLEIPDADFSKFSMSAVAVCLAARGYPDDPIKGDKIWGLDREYPNVIVQQAGVKDGETAGGRVLHVTGVGNTINEAADAAYAAIDMKDEGPESGKIGFPGRQVRSDIGHQARS